MSEDKSDYDFSFAVVPDESEFACANTVDFHESSFRSIAKKPMPTQSPEDIAKSTYKNVTKTLQSSNKDSRSIVDFLNEEMFQTTLKNIKMYNETVGNIPSFDVNNEISHLTHIIEMQAEAPTREGLQSFMDINTVIVDIMSHLKCDILQESNPGSDTTGLMYYIQIMFSKYSPP